MDFLTKNKLKLLITGGSNQAISSLTTFLLNFYLISIFNPEEYGLFGLGFAIILFVGAIMDAILFTQMVIIYPSIEKKKADDFISNIFTLLILFCCAIIIFTLFICTANFFYLKEKYFSNYFILSISSSSIFFSLKEFLVRVSYNNRREKIAIYIHSTILLFTVICYLILLLANLKIDVHLVFLIFSISHFVSIIVGLGFLKIGPKISFFLKELNSVFKQVWQQGKWACLSNFVLMLRLHAYTIIATILFNVGAVGKLNAARLFITPALIIIPVIVQLSMPRLSVLRENNVRELFNKARLISIFFFLISFVYSITLILSYKSISNTFLSESYQNLYPIVILWCLYSLFLSVRNGQLLITQILQKFKKLSLIYVMSSVITMFFCYLFGLVWGLNGIITGLITGEFFIIIMLYKVLSKSKKIIYD